MYHYSFASLSFAKISKLTVIVKDSERFVDDLERLCKKHAGYAYFMKCSVDSELESNEKEGAIKYGKEERQ